MSGGMEYRFTISVSGTGEMEAAAEAAEHLEHALDGARDAEMELGAAGAEATAGMAAQAAAMDAAAASVRDLDKNGLANLNRRISEGAALSRDIETGIRGAGAAFKEARVHIDRGGEALRDAERAGRDAEEGIAAVEGAASAASSGSGGLKKLMGVLGPLGTPALWTVIAGGAAGAVPAVLSLGGGFAAFAGLAAPALYKVKTGLSEVAYAQQQYQLAKGVAQRDPTKSNLQNQQRALAALKTTWAQLPSPVRGAVSEVRQFEKAWSRASRKSGIQKDALGDIKLAMQDAKQAIPAVTQLAHAFQPIIHGGLKDLGKEFKSKGFKDFIHTLKQDMGPAAHALKGIGNAVGGFITSLTKREAKPGTQMLQSIGKFLKTITPGAVTALTGITKGISGFFSMMTKVASSGAVSNLVGDVKGLFTGIHNVAHDFNSGAGIGQIFHDIVHFGQKPQVAKLKIAAQVTSAGVRERDLLNSLGFRQGVLGGKAGGATVTVRVKPKIEGSGTNLAKELDASQALKAHAATVPVKVKADGGDIRKQVSDAAKTGGNIPLKGRVTLTGLAAGIKSQIASLHIPSSKIKINVQVAGVGSAKAAMASVVAAAKHDAAAAAAALNSLGAAGAAAGRALDQGLAGGILAGESSVVAAASQVAGAAGAAARAAAGISSPSKVWHGIGKNMILGLVLGLEGGKAQVQAAARAITGAAAPFRDQAITQTIKKLREDVRKAFRAGDIGKHQRDGLIDYIDHGNQRLMKLARQRARIMGEIKAATALAHSVTQAAIGSADITGFAANVAAAKNAGKPSGSIQDQQKAQLAKIKEFTGDIRKLKRQGLDKTSIRQLLAAGVSGGLPAAQTLLAEGPKAVRESAKLQKEIAKASRQLGITGANAAYESASQIGKGLAKGLRNQLKPIVAAMRDIARALIATLAKELGLKPGQSLKDLFGGLGGGGGHGGHGGGHKHHGNGLGKIHELPGGGHLIATGPGLGQRMHPGSGPPAVHVTVHVQNNTYVGGARIATEVQTHSLRHARRNVATGLKLAGRAA